LRGFAKFIDKNTVDVDGEIITADHILIATGGKPRKPNIEGGEYAIDSDEVFYLPEQPDHITIIGGGYIAVEFAHIFSGMGSKVTLMYRGDLFLRGFDRDIREFLAAEMRKQNIDLRFDTDMTQIVKNGDNDFTVHTNTNDKIDTNMTLISPRLGWVKKMRGRKVLRLTCIKLILGLCVTPCLGVMSGH